VPTSSEQGEAVGADENAAVVRRSYEALNTADMKTLTEIFDESASWHTPGGGSLAGDYEGREATFAYFGQLGQRSGGTFKATLRHVLQSDDGRVVGIHYNTAERDRKLLDVECCLVFEFKDGRVIDGREHFYDLYSWDEFWL